MTWDLGYCDFTGNIHIIGQSFLLKYECGSVYVYKYIPTYWYVCIFLEYKSLWTPAISTNTSEEKLSIYEF